MAGTEEDEKGNWQRWISVGFLADGTMTWKEDNVEGTGTWEYDGADTISVRFDTVLPSLGINRLSLEVDEFERSCGEQTVDEPWDALTAPHPALRFEPAVC